MNTKIYIDSANLNFGTKSIGVDLNYEKFYKYLKHKFKNSNIKFFVGYILAKDEFYNLLKNIGYEMQYKEVTSHRGITKGNVDAEMVLSIAVDIVENNVKEIIICSGDGDFSCVIDFALKRNVLVWVIAPQVGKCSYLIRRYSNRIKVVYLEKVSKVKLE